jgi:hypothetical protein
MNKNNNYTTKFISKILNNKKSPTVLLKNFL